jgi:plasmid replication initiation protein
MITLIHKNDKDLKDYRIRVSDFSKLLELKNKNIHSQVRQLLLRLLDRSIIIEKGKHSFLGMGWVSSAEYIAEEGIVELSFDKKLKPYLLQLKREFTKLNLFTIVQFRSNYTMRIYMFLKQYEKIGKREFDLLDFREKLGIENKYKKFKDLRKRVVNQAKKELDKKDKQGNFISDISFNFEPIKRGRNVTRLRFVIFQNKNNTFKSLDSRHPVKPEIPALESSTIDRSKELKQLLDFGVAGATAEEILKKYPTDYIQEKLQLTTEENRKSPVGFFIKAVENDYKSKKIAQEKIKKEKEKKALERKKEAELNTLIVELGEEY